MKKSPNHKIAVRDFDGNMSVVEADEIRVCVPTAACLQFWATIGSCLIGLGVALFLMIWQGSDSAYFKAGEGLMGLSVGVLIPGPAYSKVLPKKQKPARRKRRPAKRARSAPPAGSAPAPKTADEHIPLKGTEDIV